jgi:hypothetical protein
LFIRLGILGVVIIIGIIVAVVKSHTDPGSAAVGDCIGALPSPSDPSVSASADQAKQVDCNSPDAQAKVLGVLSDKSEDDFNNSDVETLCKDWPNANYAFYEQTSDNSNTGTILCLQRTK